MDKNINFYPWFKKIIDACISLFFVFAMIANLFVYSSVFSGAIKYTLLVITIIVFGLIVYFFKEKIKQLLNKLIEILEKQDKNKLLIIFILTAISLKVVYTVFFYFDSTTYGGDITVYSNIAQSIVEKGLSSTKDYIYYLVGMGLHLSMFKLINIPYHIGVFVFFLIATIINYYSFSSLIGKEKSFILITLYLLMPSTTLLTFCITHELFVYFYFSIVLFMIKCFINSNNKTRYIYAIGILLFVSLNQSVSPIGKIWFIVLFLLIVLTNMRLDKRIVLVVVLILSVVSTNVLTTSLEGNTASQSNNYEQLLIGSDLESMGRHTDGKGKAAAKKYWAERGVELTYDNLVEGEKGALIEQYKYLLTHPFDLIRLLSNKFYTVWSGDFYSVEYAYLCNGINSITYYPMLIIGAAIWLIVMTIGVVYYKKKEENIGIYKYKLIVLGIMAVLLITEVTNKYSCYMTMFIYFVAFARTSLNGGKDHE